jgi:hypothetical protein
MPRPRFRTFEIKIRDSTDRGMVAVQMDDSYLFVIYPGGKRPPPSVLQVYNKIKNKFSASS